MVMKKVSLLLTHLIVALVIFSATNLSAQDWPQWRGTNHDGIVTGFKAPAVWPPALTKIWNINVGWGDGSPVLSGGRLYLLTRQGADEVVLCLDAATGKELWKNSYAAAAVAGPSASAHPGPRSTPAIANGKLVTFGVTGILSCFNASDGKLLWRKENPTNAWPVFYTGTSPLITDGMCIIHVGKKDDGQLIAYDLVTGNEKWKWTGDGPSYSSPSVMTVGGTRLLIAVTEKNIIALGLPDGKLQWQVAAPVQSRFYNSVSPYIDGQTIIISGQGSGSKALKVEKQGNQFTAKELWTNPEVGAKWNTPVLKEGFLYGFTDQKRIYCISSTTGQTAWIDPVLNSDFATIVDCGLVIIGLTQTDNLIVIKPDSKEYKELAKYKVAETPIYAYPVISGDNVYIKDAESLTLFKIK
jgi:outer membrane protein assembly factor BamB